MDARLPFWERRYMEENVGEEEQVDGDGGEGRGQRGGTWQFHGMEGEVDPADFFGACARGRRADHPPGRKAMPGRRAWEDAIREPDCATQDGHGGGTPSQAALSIQDILAEWEDLLSPGAQSAGLDSGAEPGLNTAGDGLGRGRGGDI
ncbi:hypothetical protein CYMTET_52719 [Cymbomonas tetramitiformis]|uniref:Uncharacterized protein n=1 Tax=Cymbomonas tetramitiformis TaxID=36881 RepID=A0AAE0BIH6_9CHLO|nr:hypothetical protein CYMTET_52719 [Cymbomonas tetramitiformis]